MIQAGELLSLEVLIDALTQKGGGFKVLPGGRIETFVPLGTGWRRRYYDRRSGEEQSEAVKRALGLTLDAEMLEDLDGEAVG